MSTTTKARERPIVLGGPEVRATLAGRKTMFRRPVKPKPLAGIPTEFYFDAYNVGLPVIDCPFGLPGDRLWVRETWFKVVTDAEDWIAYKADPGSEEMEGIRWRSSTTMPRWASRLTLRVESVRVERLQAITPEDAVAEGIEIARPVAIASQYQREGVRVAFACLWDPINAKRGFPWESNCWVWVVAFSVESTGRSS